MKRLLSGVAIVILIICQIEIVNAIEVTSIDIDYFESTMNVGDNQKIELTLYPVGVETNISYKSSNPSVAEVSEGGKITAKKKGDTIITIQAGAIEKKLEMTVIVETESINLPYEYIVIKQGDKFKIEATVSPEGANKDIKYKSTDTNIVKVDKAGVAKGLKSGSASILVSNGQLTDSITVIVNKELKQTGNNNVTYEKYENIFKENEDIIDYINSSGSEIIYLDEESRGIINEEILELLQEKKKTLVIRKDLYEITLHGEDIINCENVFNGEIDLIEYEEGAILNINNGDPLPGLIKIKIKDKRVEGFNYVYLKNNSKSKYEFIDVKRGNNVIYVDLAGEYYLTAKKLDQFNIEIWHIIVCILTLVCIFCVYIFLKRRYWFW